MKKNIFTLLLLLTFCTHNSFTQTISTEATVDSTQYLIGDKINFKIKIDFTNDIKLFPFSLKDSLKGVELLSVEKPVITKSDKITKIEFKYSISKYDSGNVTIPPIEIYYLVGLDTLNSNLLYLTNEEMSKNSAFSKTETNHVNFRVNLIQVDLKKEFKDVKAPIKIPFDWKEFFIWFLIIVIVLSILYYFYYRYKKKHANGEAKINAIKLSPHIHAFNELKKLKGKELWQQGKIKEYHTGITDIIRKYFSERFALPALELTTFETIQLLKKDKETTKIISITEEFLRNADLVKFAKFIPVKSINEEMMNQAEEIVKITIPVKIDEAIEEKTNV